MELRLGLLNFSFPADFSTWRKYCPQSSETVPSYYVNNILLGISGKNFYFCVYFCTWLEKSEKEGGVKKKKITPETWQWKETEITFPTFSFISSFYEKKNTFQEKKVFE